MMRHVHAVGCYSFGEVSRVCPHPSALGVVEMGKNVVTSTGTFHCLDAG